MVERLKTSTTGDARRPRSLTRSTIWSAAIVLLLLLGGLSQIFAEARRAHALRQELEASFQVRSRLQLLFSTLQDGEIGERGYVITGDTAFLEPYRLAAPRVAAELQQLKLDFANDPAQSARIAEIERLSNAKLTSLAQIVELVGAGEAEQARAIVRSGRGKAIMDAVRVAMAEIQAAETQRLQRQAAASAAATRQAELLSVGFAVFLIALLLLAVLITRRTLAERAAIAGRQKAILENAIDGIMTLNPSGSIETMNPAAEALFGISQREAVGVEIGRFLDIAPDGDGPFLERVGIGGTRSSVREMEARMEGGATFHADVALGSMDLPTGRHVIVAVRDASERRRVDRMKQEFISTVSHELRTPLTSIAGSLSLLLGGVAGDLPEKGRRLIEIANNNCRRLVRLINDLLDIEKIAAGQLEMRSDRVDLGDVAATAITDTQAYADQHGVKLVLLDGDAQVVMGDRDRLLQVVTNLLSNAAKFSPNGSDVDISVEAAGDVARLKVRDRGPGIPEAFRDRIFGRFAQATAADTRERQGTGLGLAIVKEIVERHGGSVRFEAAEGSGTVFIVELPRLAAPIPAQTAAPSAPGVLICEDDPDAASVLAQLVAAQGYAAKVVHDISSAREALANDRFETLILDVHLPDGNGLTFLSEVKGPLDLADLPVVVVTGVDPAASAERIGVLGLVDWIPKPVDPDRLRRALERAVGSPQKTGVRILHVDDDPDIREIVSTALIGLGDLVGVDRLSSARAQLAMASFDAVVLDLDLPDGSGLELLPIIDREGRPVPAVIFSAKELPAPSRLGDVPAITKSKASLETLGNMLGRLVKR